MGVGPEISLKSHLRSAIALLAIFTVITGFLYPVLVTIVAQVFFPGRAKGSIVVEGGKPVGSSLVGQSFDDPRYFWGRLSATSPVPYTAFNSDKGTGSSGSNLGPLNPALKEAVQSRIRALKETHPGAPRPIPVDLVTASGSGLDPDISPAAADYQVERVARVRGVNETSLRTLIESHTRPPEFGVLGEPQVNVLELNLALDRATAKSK